jgi:hypothetical protein
MADLHVIELAEKHGASVGSCWSKDCKGPANITFHLPSQLEAFCTALSAAQPNGGGLPSGLRMPEIRDLHSKQRAYDEPDADARALWFYRYGWNQCRDFVRCSYDEADMVPIAKADERGSAEPVARVVRRWPHYNLGVELISERPVKEGDQLYLRSDSAQARDAAQAVELTDADIIAAMEEVDYAHELSTIARAIERAVLAKNGLGGKQ